MSYTVEIPMAYVYNQILFSDGLGLSSRILQGPFQPKGAASIVAHVC